MRSRLLASLAVITLVLAGCSSAATAAPAVTSAPAASTAASGSLTIYGAASLSAVLAKVKTAYETAYPGMSLTISTGSSTALETQIEQGAPGDVFLSADTGNPQKLVSKGLAAGAPVNFAGNLLTIIVPAANPASIATPANLAKPGVKIIAAADSVPISKYATQLVANLAKQPGYPADFVAAYTANVVSKEDDVSAVVAKIALDEGDAGIVYVTDAKTSTQVTSIAVPAAANVPATYAGVVVKGSKNLAAAQAFLTWFAGSAGQAILASFGFLPPPS
ncbi:MAG: molybdate ABC transporter substrate-binding protein [Candidatus Limnocylindrales bacterium]